MIENFYDYKYSDSTIYFEVSESMGHNMKTNSGIDPLIHLVLILLTQLAW
jgi:hypothetical protein